MKVFLRGVILEWMEIHGPARPTVTAVAAPEPATLVNDGELSLTFIGAGSAFSKKYYQNNLLIVKGQDHLLVDCGTRTPEALAALGLSVTNIKNYLITHTHADHIGGLEEVMLLNRYFARQKAAIVVTPRLRDILWSWSLRGGAAYNEVHEGRPLTFEDFWDPIFPRRVRGADRELAVARVGNIELALFRTKHIPDTALSWRDSFPSYGLVIDRRILFTSDSRYDPELVLAMDAAYPLEAIFHDCQLFPGGVHAYLEELAALPPAIKAKTRLMHYGDKVEEFHARIAELGFAGLAEEWRTYRFPVAMAH